MCKLVLAVVLLVYVVSSNGYGYIQPQPYAPIGFIPFYGTNYTYNATQNATNYNNQSRNGFNCLPNDRDLPGAHSLLVGCRTNVDKLLFRESYLKASRFWSTREKNISYPGAQLGGMIRHEKIYAILCYDKLGNGKGGFATITSGGVGYNHVNIRLYTENAGKGFNFLVEMYGH